MMFGTFIGNLLALGLNDCQHMNNNSRQNLQTTVKSNLT